MDQNANHACLNAVNFNYLFPSILNSRSDLVANLPFFSNRNGPYRPPEKVKLFDNCQNGKWYAYNCVQSHRCKALHKMSLQEIKVGFDICQEINKCQPNSHMLVHKSLEIFYAFKHGHIFFEA